MVKLRESWDKFALQFYCIVRDLTKRCRRDNPEETTSTKFRAISNRVPGRNAIWTVYPGRISSEFPGERTRELEERGRRVEDAIARPSGGSNAAKRTRRTQRQREDCEGSLELGLEIETRSSFRGISSAWRDGEARREGKVRRDRVRKLFKLRSPQNGHAAPRWI